MSKSYPIQEFNRSRLRVRPLSERQHDLTIQIVTDLIPARRMPKDLAMVARRIRAAKSRSSAVILMAGAHVLRSGVQRYIIDLMERGYVSCLALNGAGVIHDYEMALIGATTESVARYVATGQFGLWKETGRINDIVKVGARKGMGLGEAVGRVIEREKFPHRDVSVLAAGYRLGVPVTVHVGIGYDILHEHPNCDGAAYGATSYRDFLRFVRIVESLEGGVVMNFGSAIMAPEVFLKALAMARNVAHARGRRIRHFTSLVADVRALAGDVHREPARDNPDYYFRPWKTMLARTVADGGQSYYVRGLHRDTVPQLWTAIGVPKRAVASTLKIPRI